MAQQPDNKSPSQDVPVITVKALIIIHIFIAIFLALGSWICWSIPQ